MNETRRHIELTSVAIAARKIVAIEDLYRDLPPDLRRNSLPAFEPKHRKSMDELRAALERLDA